MKPKKVLLVDDHETALMLENIMLTTIASEFITARNGEEAVELALRYQPDLILMDVKMPILDGIESCRRIKKNPKSKHIPVIMVTTKGEKETVKKAEAAGCNAFVTKPIDKEDLFRKIKMVTSEPPPKRKKSSKK